MEDLLNYPLLKTKLYKPGVGKNVIPRQEIFPLLENSDNCRLILVTAPAGFGKSTLISSWINQQNINTTWISLDENDNQYLIFISYLIQALRNIEPALGQEALRLINASEAPPLKMLLMQILNDLAGLKEPLQIVLDDYHVIQNQEIHQAVDYLLANSPDQIKYILLSRQFPELSLSKLRANNQILELNSNHLRFSSAETEKLFDNVLKWKLPLREINIINQRTEGWVTGLQLAALGLKDPDSTRKFIDEFHGDNKQVSEYLLDEVLVHLPPATQDFLIQTSILERLSAPLCNFILGIDNSHEIINFLEQENLFLISLDESGNWFRYHHLFRNFLVSRLQKTSADTSETLYQKTINWFEGEGALEEAVEYAIASQNFDKAAALMRENFCCLQNGLQQAQVHDWLMRIPQENLRKYADNWLQLHLSYFYYSDFDISLNMIDEYQRLTPDQKLDEDPLIPAVDILLRGVINLHTSLDAEKVVQLTRKALDLIPEEDLLMRGIAFGHLGSASMILGQMKTALESLEEAIRIIELNNNWPVLYVFQTYYAETHLTLGNLLRAEEIYKVIHRHAHDRDVVNALFSSNLIGLAVIYYEWNQVEIGEKYLREGFQLLQTNTTIDRMLKAANALLKYSFLWGDFSELENYLNQMEKIAGKYDYPLRVMDHIEAIRSAVALEIGSLQEAARWAHLYGQRYQNTINCQRQYEWLIVSKIWFGSGHIQQTIQTLQELLSLADQEGRERDWVRIAVLLANAEFEVGSERQALELLGQAITAAESQGYIRSFVDGGEHIQTMLEKIESKTKSSTLRSSYIQRILAAYPPEQETKPLYDLSEREIEVVELLAEGYSYLEISEKLMISINTVKFHIKNIFNELDVNNRTRAVIQAQEHGLI